MPRASTISARQITGAARKSVDRVLAQNRLKPLRPIIVGFVPPWWWLGFVLRDSEVWTMQAAEQVAVDVQRGVASAVPALKGSQAGAMIVDGHITIGFIPPRQLQGIGE
jgi:hypothetical protein